MKKYLIPILLSCFFICNEGYGQRLSWPLGDVSVEKLDQRVFTYHMFDTTGVKVGTMVTKLTVYDDKIVFIDTSKFDNGSIYEDASFIFSKNPIQALETKIAIKTPRSSLEFSFQTDSDSVKGVVLVGEDEKPVKIPADYDVTRAELYAFLHAIDFTKPFKHELNVFEPTSVGITKASIEFQGEMELQTPDGLKKVYKVYLDGKGKIPTNRIFIEKESSRVIKYEVMTPMRLNIVLVNSK